MAKMSVAPASTSKPSSSTVAGKLDAVVSAYLAFSKSVRADVKRSLPADASGVDIMRAIGARWKGLSKEDKKPFVNQRNAWLFSQGRTPKNLGGASRGLPPGWVKDVIGGKKVFVHLASNVVTSKKPMDRDALTHKESGIKRPLSAYGSFVKTNFKKYGSLKDVATAWKGLSDSKKETYKAAADASKADYQTKVLAA
jgi:hypothetical protein